MIKSRYTNEYKKYNGYIKQKQQQEAQKNYVPPANTYGPPTPGTEWEKQFKAQETVAKQNKAKELHQEQINSIMPKTIGVQNTPQNIDNWVKNNSRPVYITSVKEAPKKEQRINTNDLINKTNFTIKEKQDLKRATSSDNAMLNYLIKQTEEDIKNNKAKDINKAQEVLNILNNEKKNRDEFNQDMKAGRETVGNTLSAIETGIVDSVWGGVNYVAKKIDSDNKRYDEIMLNGLKRMPQTNKSENVLENLILSKEEKINNRNNIFTKVSDFAGNIQDKASNLTNRAIQKSQEISPISGKITEYGAVVGNMLPGMVASASGVPGLGTGTFIATASGGYLKDAEDRGLTDDKAVSYAGIMGTVEGLSERLSFGKLSKGIKTLTKGTIKEGIIDAGIGTLENAVQEAIIEPVSEVASGVLGGESTFRDENGNINIFSKEAWKELGPRMLNSGIDGASVYVLLGGIGAGYTKATKIGKDIMAGKQISQTTVNEAIQEISDSGVDIEKVEQQYAQKEKAILEQLKGVENTNNTLYNNNRGDINGEQQTDIIGQNQQDDRRRVQNIFENYRRGQTNEETMGNEFNKKTTESEVKLAVIDYANKYSKNKLSETEIKLSNIINKLGGKVVFYELGEENNYIGLSNTDSIYIDVLGDENVENVFYHEIAHFLRQNNNEIYIKEIQPIVDEIAINDDYQENIFGYANSREGITISDLLGNKNKIFAEEVIADQIASMYGNLKIDYELNNEIKTKIKTAMDKILNNDNINNYSIPSAKSIKKNSNKSSFSMEQNTQVPDLIKADNAIQEQKQEAIAEGAKVLNKKTKLEDIADMSIEKDMELPELRYKAKKDKKTNDVRQFYENVETSKIVSQEVKDRLEPTTYEIQHDEDVLKKMAKKLDEKGNSLVIEWEKKDIKEASEEDVALGAILLERYQQKGDTKSTLNVIKKLADMGTVAGRTVQMYSVFQRMQPEGMKIYQQRKLTEAFEELKKKKTGDWVEKNKEKFNLTEEDSEFIQAKVTEAQNAPTQREKQIALAEIEARINEKIPPEAGQSIKAYRRIAMLFNPKTQVRNVAGNTTVMPLNYVTDLVATAIDKRLAKKTGVRTTALPNVKTIAKGFGKGFSETIDDYKRGIRTTPTGSRYEIQNNAKSFNEHTNSKALNAIARKANAVDRILSTVLEAGDRPFYEAAYQNSLEGQMKANGVTEPTQEMIDIASNVALSQTWQDNNNYTKAVLSVRSAMNKLNINGFGLGDILIPFAKTPANLTKAMVEYSPAGLIPTLINYNNMQKAISRGEFTAQQQKNFVNSVGKTVAGTLLYILAGALAKSGAITGSADEDKDIANFEKNILGIQPYSIKIGDKTFTYNWAQPIAAPFAIVAETYKMSKEKAELSEIILNAFRAGGNQLAENSFLQGIQNFLSSEYGNESLMDNVIDIVLDLPAQFTPTLLGQVATVFDDTKRQTFEKGDRVQTMVNEVKNKIPGAKNTLAPQVDTFGNEVENYGGNNNLFNIFLNPANESSTNATDTQKELYALYEATKDKTIFPRQAPYTVEGGGEKLTLSSKEREKYQKISGEYVTENLDALFDSKFYQSLDDKKKVAVVNKIVSDADTTAKDEWVDTESTEDLAKLKKELGSVPLVDYYNAYIAQKDAEEKKNNKGKTISGTKSKAKKQAIDKATPGLSKKERETLYEIFNVGKTAY